MSLFSGKEEFMRILESIKEFLRRGWVQTVLAFLVAFISAVCCLASIALSSAMRYYFPDSKHGRQAETGLSALDWCAIVATWLVAFAVVKIGLLLWARRAPQQFERTEK
jgi:hypothetical protein